MVDSFAWEWLLIVVSALAPVSILEGAKRMRTWLSRPHYLIWLAVLREQRRAGLGAVP